MTYTINTSFNLDFKVSLKKVNCEGEEYPKELRAVSQLAIVNGKPESILWDEDSGAVWTISGLDFVDLLDCLEEEDEVYVIDFDCAVLRDGKINSGLTSVELEPIIFKLAEELYRWVIT